MTVRPNSGTQFEISVDGVPRSYRDRQDIALQTARFPEVPKSEQRRQAQGLAVRQGDRGGVQDGAVIAMPLKMHRSVVSYSGYYKETVNYSVFCGERYIGYIYENGRAPEGLRWFWALHAPGKRGTMRTSNQAVTLEAAKAEFEASWKQWKSWAGMEEVP